MHNYQEYHSNTPYVSRTLTLGYYLTYRTISWEELSPFLRMSLINNRDVDTDVLRLRREQLQTFHCEGIYLNDRLVGFGRYDTNRLHLAQLYVDPSYRGLGVGREYMNTRNIQGLWVMPENQKAIALYSSMGFKVIGEAPGRLYMSRVPFHLAKMPA